MAEIINGKLIAASIRKALAEEVRQMKNQDPNFMPGLVIVQVSIFVAVKIWLNCMLY